MRRLCPSCALAAGACLLALLQVCTAVPCSQSQWVGWDLTGHSNGEGLSIDPTLQHTALAGGAQANLTGISTAALGAEAAADAFLTNRQLVGQGQEVRHARAVGCKQDGSKHGYTEGHKTGVSASRGVSGCGLAAAPVPRKRGCLRSTTQMGLHYTARRTRCG